jgi:hypothetical protein
MPIAALGIHKIEFHALVWNTACTVVQMTIMNNTVFAFLPYGGSSIVTR